MIVLSDDDIEDDGQIFWDVPTVEPNKKTKMNKENDKKVDRSYLLDEKDNDAVLNMPVSCIF